MTAHRRDVKRVGDERARLGDPLRRGLEAQRDRLLAVKSIAALQAQALRDGDEAALLDLLDERSRLIADAIAAQPEIDAIATKVDGETLEDADVSHVVDELRRTLVDIRENDRRDVEAIENRLEELREELSGAGTGRAAARAYQPANAGTSARFTDRHG